MNLFGIKREFGDISNVKSQKAVSNANLDFKINELRRKISQNIKVIKNIFISYLNRLITTWTFKRNTKKLN